MKKRIIGVYIPLKKTIVLKTRTIKTGFVPEEVRNKIYHLIEKDPSVKIIKNMNFKNCYIKNNEVLGSKGDWNKLDKYFWYSPINYNNADSYHIKILDALSGKCKVSTHPDAVKISIDKLVSHSLLKRNNIKVADFTLFSSDNIEHGYQILDEWGEMLIKPRFGRFGIGIFMVKDKDTLRDVIQYIKFSTNSNNLQIFAEKFHQNDMKNWVSATVIGGKCIYGYRKKSSKIAGWKVLDEKRIGGEAYYVDPKPVAKTAEKAAKIIGADIIGFDFIKTKKGYIIVDENTFPGMYEECFKEAKKDWAKLFADLILKK